MAAYDERPSDAERRERELDRRMELKFALLMWMLGLFTGANFVLFGWIISRLP